MKVRYTKIRNPRGKDKSLEATSRGNISRRAGWKYGNLWLGIYKKRISLCESDLFRSWIVPHKEKKIKKTTFYVPTRGSQIFIGTGKA